MVSNQIGRARRDRLWTHQADIVSELRDGGTNGRSKMSPKRSCAGGHTADKTSGLPRA